MESLPFNLYTDLYALAAGQIPRYRVGGSSLSSLQNVSTFLSSSLYTISHICKSWACGHGGMSGGSFALLLPLATLEMPSDRAHVKPTGQILRSELIRVHGGLSLDTSVNTGTR